MINLARGPCTRRRFRAESWLFRFTIDVINEIWLRLPGENVQDQLKGAPCHDIGSPRDVSRGGYGDHVVGHNKEIEERL